ncbi:CrcB family protein [Gordonia cholesterolivorans]|uniref:Fluoride-specific ion channel FluC n=1 Tax=Gordonia cholesterolivorans TaxID=559625 RepID=A0ABN3GZP9_9ACTN
MSERMHVPDALRGTGVIWVFLGGMAGTFVRWLAEENLPSGKGRWPWDIFTVNIAGALILGFLLQLLLRLGPDAGLRKKIRLGVGTGFCGSLTTYSSFALDLSDLGRDGFPYLAAGYAAASVFIGLIAVAVGVAAARRYVPQPAEATP